MAKFARRLVGLVAAVMAFAAWVVMMRADSANVYIEPTTKSIADAAAARPVALSAASALIVLVLVVARLRRRRWVAVFALPGALTIGLMIAFPASHGAALLYSLLGSATAAATASIIVVRAMTARRAHD